jgi:hypothetical protein
MSEYRKRQLQGANSTCQYQLGNSHPPTRRLIGAPDYGNYNNNNSIHSNARDHPNKASPVQVPLVTAGHYNCSNTTNATTMAGFRRSGDSAGGAASEALHGGTSSNNNTRTLGRDTNQHNHASTMSHDTPSLNLSLPQQTPASTLKRRSCDQPHEEDEEEEEPIITKRFKAAPDAPAVDDPIMADNANQQEELLLARKQLLELEQELDQYRNCPTRQREKALEEKVKFWMRALDCKRTSQLKRIQELPVVSYCRKRERQLNSDRHWRKRTSTCDYKNSCQHPNIMPKAPRLTWRRSLVALLILR